MALQHQSSENSEAVVGNSAGVSNEASIADARVTPEEFSNAVAAIEARRLARQAAEANTVPVAKTIEELALEVTPAEVLAEVEAQRQAAASVQREEPAPVSGQAAATLERTHHPGQWVVVAAAAIFFFSTLFTGITTHRAVTTGHGARIISVAARSHGPVKIKCGSDVSNGPFIADTDFVGGRAVRNYSGAIDTGSVINPAPQAVYHAERYGEMTYALPGFKPGAPYRVRLHFCENYFESAGKRVFDVTLNNKLVLNDFDILATSGAKHRANIQTFVVHADDNGEIVINFSKVVNEPMINAIDVQPSKPDPVSTSK